MNDMTIVSFEVDARTLKVIDELKGTFGVTTKGEVFSKALALSRIAARHADNGEVVIAGNEGGERVSLGD